MFLLDLYRFCESYDHFNRQHLAKFIFKHRECERLARAANVTPRMFATSCSKEFLARMCTSGYLDLKNGVATCYGSHKRPFGFELRCIDGMNDKYTREMVNIGEMTDDQLFGKPAFN